LADHYQCSWGTCYLQLLMWRQELRLKWLSTRLYGITFQKTIIFWVCHLESQRQFMFYHFGCFHIWSNFVLWFESLITSTALLKPTGTDLPVLKRFYLSSRIKQLIV
jgi:hypothetical protein